MTAECRVWPAARNAEGYGIVGVGSGCRLAHRVTYEREVGPIPAGLELDHLCRNRACVNPAHLEPVTHAENMRRGRRSGGAAANLAKSHCPAGHPYDETNTYTLARGRRVSRYCRACHAAVEARRREARRG